MKLLVTIVSALFLFSTGVSAQVGYGKVETPWFQQGKISGGISVSGTSSATALPAIGLIAWVCNTGANDAYLAFGTANTVAATVNSSSWLKAGTCGNYDLFAFKSLSTFVAAITASSTTTLAVETGTGTGPQQLSTSNSGGSTTANQGTPGALTAGWPVSDSAGTDTTGSFTGTGAATLNATIDGYASAKIQIKGTYAAFTVNTLVSSDGGTTFVPIQCTLADGSLFGTSFALSANQSTEISCGHLSGDDALQLQTSVGPATGTANIDISPAAFPNGDGIAVQVGKTVLPPGAAIAASQTFSGVLTNPSGSTLTLPATTTAYSAGQLIANSATAGSVANPSFAIANSGGGASIPRVRLMSNDNTSTAWHGVTVQVDLWSTTPTWTNGDRGVWLPATGTAGHLATYTCTFPSAEWGDGIATECGVNAGSAAYPRLASGTSIFWSLQAVTATPGVTGASKVFSLVPEIVN